MGGEDGGRRRNGFVVEIGSGLAACRCHQYRGHGNIGVDEGRPVSLCDAVVRARAGRLSYGVIVGGAGSLAEGVRATRFGGGPGWPDPE